MRCHDTIVEYENHHFCAFPIGHLGIRYLQHQHLTLKKRSISVLLLRMLHQILGSSSTLRLYTSHNVDLVVWVAA